MLIFGSDVVYSATSITHYLRQIPLMDSSDSKLGHFTVSESPCLNQVIMLDVPTLVGFCPRTARLNVFRGESCCYDAKFTRLNNCFEGRNMKWLIALCRQNIHRIKV
jgi:hypothetical protein